MIWKIFDLRAKQTDRLAWIDYAKGIAITLVVFRHVTVGLHLAEIDIDPFVYELIKDVGLTFRMPLFFLLSGIFFRKSIEKRSKLGYTQHKAKTILYPYFIWSLLMTTGQLLLSNYVNADVSLYSYLNILTDPWGHWWFLYALFNVSVLYLLFYLLANGNKYLLLAIGLLLYYTSPYLEGISVPYDICRLFIFFVIGDLISTQLIERDNRSLFLSYPILIGLGIAAVVGEILIFNIYQTELTVLLIFALVGSAFTMIISYRMAEANNRKVSIIRTLGQHSLYIYLLHAPTSAAFRIVLHTFLHVENFYILLTVGFLVGLFSPIFIYRICKTFGMWFLFTPDSPVKTNKSYNLKPVKN